MSDLFNPNHYLPSSYLNSLNKEVYAKLSLQKNNLLNNIKNSQSNVFVNIPLDLTVDKNEDIIIIQNQEHNVDKIFNIHVNSNISSITIIPINADDTIIYNYYKFFIYGKTKITFITFRQNNKIKNKIEQFLMNEISEVENIFYSDISSKQYLDDSLEVFHESKNTKSTTNYKSYTDGKIVTQINSIIQEESYNSETKQHIKHIATSNTANIFSKPNLIIKNPNVVASHGNSIGNISKEEIFYLEQRGISEKDSKLLLKNSSFINNFENHALFNILNEYYIKYEH
jgi:Fe-S cluster assembly scaffold protein SufB